MGALASFASDADGERLNQLLGAAGSSAKRLGEKALTGSVSMANKAIAGGKVLAETAQQKAEEFKEARDEKARQITLSEPAPAQAPAPAEPEAPQPPDASPGLAAVAKP